MSKAGRTEGPCAPLFYAAAALLLISAKITTAQTVDLSTLELCASLKTQELKLACFEAIVANSQVTPEVTPVVSVTPSDEDFGREQLAAPDQEEKKEVIKAMVIDVTQGYNKSLYFHLANGHIWRQIEPRRFQYPKQGDFEVSISQGMMGDYRLRIGDNGRMVRIRRVQ